jgi:phosphoribosyl 1,2-cyclic phosphate phosphodiesterase
MDQLTITILGCGSSGGVPRLGLNGSPEWGDCDPANPKNIRRRCSLLVTRANDHGTTRVLIDTSPDLRMQLLDAQAGTLDAVIYTHAHADHVHGIDDLRMIVINMRKRLPVWADPDTCDALISRFGYAFVQPAGSSYPPICDLHQINGPTTIHGAGGAITLNGFTVEHGDIHALGFRIGPVAYLPDVSAIPDAAWAALENLDCWIVDCLRRTPHPSHTHLERTLQWIARAAPKQAVLTNMHIDLDYTQLDAETPAHITPAYDGMTLTFPY